MNWRDINELIKRCRALPNRDDVLSCLLELYRQTGDGMVAHAIGQEYESRGAYGDAERWYNEAYSRFPLPQFKQKALADIERVRSKCEPRAAAGGLGSNLPDLGGMEPAETLLIVACTKTKIWEIDPEAPPYVPARYAYCGEGFKAFTRWLEEGGIESRGFRWLILSARYGYIDPWHPVEDYDVTFSDPQTGPISDETLYSQVMFQARWRDRKPLRDFRSVLYSGGADYGERIRRSFRDLRLQVSELRL